MITNQSKILHYSPFQIRFDFLWFLLIVVNPLQIAFANDESLKSDAVQRLLPLVPASTESMFCYSTRFKLSKWDKLSAATIPESCAYFTAYLASMYKNELGLSGRRVLGAVSAVKRIRYPKQNSKTGIAMGAFESHRCELLLLSEEVTMDWADTLSKAVNSDVLRIGDQTVFKLRIGDNDIFVTAISAHIVCIANDELYLKEFLSLARKTNGVDAKPIIATADFKAAGSLVSKEARFWGIRLFCKPVDAKDPTTLLNERPLVGVQDPASMFAVIEVLKMNSTEMTLYYGSNDALVVAKRFPKSLGSIVTKLRTTQRTLADDARKAVHLATITCDLAVGGDEAGVLLLGLFTLFGHGMVL